MYPSIAYSTSMAAAAMVAFVNLKTAVDTNHRILVAEANHMAGVVSHQ